MTNGWNETNGTTDHGQTMRYVRSLTNEQVLFVRKDAHEALQANPESKKAGYYADLVSYCGMRLSKLISPS